MKSAKEFIVQYDKQNGTFWSDSTDDIANVMEEYTALKVKEAVENKLKSGAQE